MELFAKTRPNPSSSAPTLVMGGGAALLTLEVSDDGEWLYCIAAVGKSLYRVVLHSAHHAEASVGTWSRRDDTMLGTNPEEMEAVQGSSGPVQLSRAQFSL